MSKVEINPITVIIAAVALVITAMATGAIAAAKYLKNKLIKCIKKLQEVHKEDKRLDKEIFNQDLSKKDEIIKKKDEIIEELLNLLKEKDERGKSLIDTTLGLKTFNIITKQRNRLNDNQDIA